MTRREARVLALLLVLGFALRLAFVLATQGHHLLGDEIEYDSEGRFIEQGHWFWTLAPTGVPHAGMWKTPIYPAFVGILYKILGPHYDRVLAVQTLFGPITILLTSVLGRRLFNGRVALVAAAVVAVCPFAWQFEVRLLPESIVTPMSLLFLILLLEVRPTVRRAGLIGVLCGVMVLTRPSAVYLVPAIATAFVLAAGWRRGILLTAGAVILAALVILPWTIRNHEVSGAWVPLSLQQIAPYGTFNNDAANDPRYPYAWRIYNRRDAPILRRARELGDVELANRLRHNTVEYVKDHPASLVEAFYWNGLTRLWDVRRPGNALGEARFTGRPRPFAAVALATYWAVLPLALFGLWLIRRRRALLLPLVVMALGASIVFTADATSRYRAPFDPLIALLAAYAGVTLLDAIRARRASGAAVGPTSPTAAQTAA
jgi:4-amino-4-deoxy-L-arabinose transferase-like glycosyltransferase